MSFECITESSASPELLFGLSLDVDVHVGSMARSKERAIDGVRAGRMSLGQEVTWSAWHFGVPIRMTSRIVALDAPDSFVDEQVRGPFRTFRHEHEFRRMATGTTMVDRISFTAPFGVLGRLAEKLVLARYLRHLIERRNVHLVTLAETETETTAG